MSIAAFARSDSMEGFPMVQVEDPINQELRKSVAKTSATVTAVGCGGARLGVQAAAIAIEHPEVAMIAVPAMTVSEVVTKEGSGYLTKEGYCDSAIRPVQTMTRNCVVM